MCAAVCVKRSLEKLDEKSRSQHFVARQRCWRCTFQIMRQTQTEDIVTMSVYIVSARQRTGWKRHTAAALYVFSETVYNTRGNDVNDRLTKTTTKIESSSTMTHTSFASSGKQEETAVVLWIAFLCQFACTRPIWRQAENKLKQHSGLPKFNGDFVVQSWICSIIFMKIRSLYPEIWATLWKNTLFRNVEESFKKFLDPDPAADDFQNLILSSLYTDTSVVKFSWRSVQ